jgi:capsular exopolysaccharide synthesis family protein
MTTINARPGIPAAATARPAAPVSGGAPATAVLDPVRLVKQHKWLLLIAIIVGAGVGLAANAILSRTSPSFTAQVIYRASPPIAGVGVGQNVTVDDKELERFLATQARLMVSESVLRAAIQDREVRENTRWIEQFRTSDGVSVDEGRAYRELVKIASGRPITGTLYMNLTVSAPRREDAQVLANAIHGAYFTALALDSARVNSEEKDPLSKQLNAIQSSINRLEADNRNLFITNGLEGTANQQETEVSEMMQATESLNTAEQQRSALKERQDRLAKQAASPGGRQYSDSQREEAERDSLVVQLKVNLANLEASEAALAAIGKKENHLDMLNLRARIDATREMLEVKRKEALEKVAAAEVDFVDQRLREAEATVRDTTAKIEALKRRRNEKAVALNQIESNRLQLANLREKEAAINAKLGDINMISELKNSDRIGRVRREQAARLPESPAFPRLEVMLPLGIFGVLGLTLGFIVIRELMDQRVRGPSDMALIPRLRLLGMVPDAEEDPTGIENVETAFKDQPLGAVSESFRQLRAPINKRMVQAGYKTLLVAAGAPESGATSLVANLAMQAAATDQRVLIIDANFRRPGLHKVFKLGEGPGLGDVLAKKVTLDQALQQTPFANLTLLSAGTAPTRSVPERLSTESMTQILAEAAAKYDLVILDTAPAMVAGDAIALANRVDAVVMVVRALSEKRGYIARLRDQLSDVRAEMLGVVLNGVRGTAGGYLKKNIRTAYEYQSAGND